MNNYKIGNTRIESLHRDEKLGKIGNAMIQILMRILLTYRKLSGLIGIDVPVRLFYRLHIKNIHFALGGVRAAEDGDLSNLLIFITRSKNANTLGVSLRPSLTKIW